jgi:hypothetical protein
MKSEILLVDVDGTLVDGKGQYNLGLIQAIAKTQAKHPTLKVVLFTSYELGEVLLQRVQKGLTRQAVRQQLTDSGIQVNAVIVSGSNQAEQNQNMGFGQYYEKVFVPIENELAQLPKENRIAQVEQLNKHSSQVLEDQAYRESNNAERRINTQAHGGNDNKEPMFRYVLNYYGKNAKLLVLDDSSAVIAAACHLREQERYAIQDYLTTVSAYQAGLHDEKSYCQLFNQIFDWERPAPHLLICHNTHQSKGFFRFFGKRRSSLSTQEESLPSYSGKRRSSLTSSNEEP